MSRSRSALVGLGLVALLALEASGCAFALRDRTYPEWRVDASAKQVPFACALATPIVVKTGKTGIGVSVVFDGGDATCALPLDAVTLRVNGREVSRAKLPELPTLAPGVRVVLYFPLPFDAQTSFNAGERSATLTLQSGAQTTSFALELVDPRTGAVAR